VSILSKLSVENFKCFRAISLPFASLSVLAGANSAGKSSLIQALLLLRQSRSIHGDAFHLDQLVLNGNLVRLGMSQDVFNSSADKDEIRFRLQWGDITREWSYPYLARERHLVSTRRTEEPIADLPGAPFGDCFQYLCADRLAPQALYRRTMRMTTPLGTRGQHAAQVLADRGLLPIEIPEMSQNGARSPSLTHQTEAWLQLVSPGIRLIVDPHPEMDAVRLAYQFVSEKRVVSPEFRPTNVGFGVTYVLPIIIALLTMRPGGLVVLENPEAHLHPHAQLEVGRLLACAAASGIQLVVETHSDHILNGIRIAVRTGTIAPEHVALHLFRQNEAPVSPRIDKNGRLDGWPTGFFDEWDRAIERLLS
jgi:predicted ATPase